MATFLTTDLGGVGSIGRSASSIFGAVGIVNRSSVTKASANSGKSSGGWVRSTVGGTSWTSSTTSGVTSLVAGDSETRSAIKAESAALSRSDLSGENCFKTASGPNPAPKPARPTQRKLPDIATSQDHLSKSSMAVKPEFFLPRTELGFPEKTSGKGGSMEGLAGMIKRRRRADILPLKLWKSTPVET